MDKQNSMPSPVLSAIMCDGIGWFSQNDYKRALLIYDEIHYLLPQKSVKFRDVSGREEIMHFPVTFYENLSFQIQYYEPDHSLLDLIVLAAKNDSSNVYFQATVEAIPLYDRIYTWRVTNTDGSLGRGKSLNLSPDEYSLAHAVLLNKFLLAADHLGCIPITGKPYIHALISEKYRTGISLLQKDRPDILPAALQTRQSRFNPVAIELVSSIVPDSELEKRTEPEILEYKENNRELFERFSYTMRQLVSKVHSLPASADFGAEVKELASTEVWRERTDIERELRSAWESFFKSTIKAIVGGVASGAITAGIAPFLSLGSITIASILAGVSTAAPWATSELLDLLEKRKKAQEHGLYYLTRFVGN